MPLTFRILPKRQLVYIRYEGYASMEETQRVFGAYLAHPDFRPGQTQLVDLARVTDYERDFVEMMRFQARIPDALFAPGLRTLFVFYCPKPMHYEMMRVAERSWDGLDAVDVRVLEHEAEVLDLLGLNPRTLDELI